MNCIHCDNPLTEGAKFCGKCGRSVSEEKAQVPVEKKEPLSTSKVVKKIFQIIAVSLLLISLPAMSSFSIDNPKGWLSTIYNIFNITAVIAFIAMVTNAWKYRKNGPKNKKWFGWRWITFLIVISLVGLGTAIFSQALTVAQEKAIQNPDNKVEYINNVVGAAKAKMSFPEQIDDSTVVTDITVEGNAIRYHYLLSDIDTSDLSNESLKNSLSPSICQSESTKELFAKGIDLEFLYAVKDSTKSYLVKFTQFNCQ